MWKIDLDGNNDMQLTSGEDWGIQTFAIQPDGDHVIFSTYKSKRILSRDKIVKDGYDLWTLDIKNR